MFDQRLVHLDLKGAPPKVSYLKAVFPLMREWGATGLCIEWEDMLPLHGRFEFLRSPYAYSERDVAAILKAAARAGLAVVPLVQTFGHLEFLLKHERFAQYREDPDDSRDLCPLHPGAQELITGLVDQVLAFHPGIDTVHLGGDEVWALGHNPATQAYIKEHRKAAVYLKHMLPVVEHVNARGLRALIWDDMLREWPVEKLRQFAGKAEPVVWRYSAEIDRGLPEGTWGHFQEAGLTLWGASAFKGAAAVDAIWPNFDSRALNHAAWVERGGQTELAGLILTGWSRHNHFSSLCEILPTGLPALALALRILQAGRFEDSMRREVFEKLGIGDMPFAHARTEDIVDMPGGDFPGADAFRLLGKLQGAKQLMWFAAEDEMYYFPSVNGGRRDVCRARRNIRKTEWAEQIALEVKKELPAALRKALFRADVKEIVDVQVRRLISEARRIRKAAAKVVGA